MERCARSSSSTSAAVALGVLAAAAIALGSSTASAQDPSPPGERLKDRVRQAVESAVIEWWDESKPIPFGYEKARRIRAGLVIGGSVLFGTVYVITALVGATLGDVGSASCTHGVCGADTRPGKLLLLPVFGPFTLMGATTSIDNGFLFFDGFLQASGTAMIAVGLAAKKTVLVRTRQQSEVRWLPVPVTFGPKSAGIGVAGVF